MKRYLSWLTYRAGVLYMGFFAVTIGSLLAFPVDYLTKVVFGPYTWVTGITTEGVFYLIAGVFFASVLTAIYLAAHRPKVIELERAGVSMQLAASVKRSWWF